MSAQLTVLERLRAYAAAHPSDVAVIAEGVRQDAETEAYRALAELTRKWRRRNSGTRLTRALARASVNLALDKAIMGGCLRVAADNSVRTDTVVGMPRPVLDEDPFPLNRVKRLPLPPKRATVRPGWIDLVRAVQRAHRRRCSRRHGERVSDQGRAGGVVASPGHD